MRGRWRWSITAGGYMLLATDGLSSPLESLQRTRWVPLDLTQTEQTTDAATGAGGNMVYISGYSKSPPGADGEQSVGALLMAYNATGAHQWVIEYRPTGNDFGYSVAADSTGVYLTGAAGAQSTGSGMDSDDDTDAFVVKYNSTGGMVWEQRWGSSDADVGNGVAVDDGSGLVYVVGKTWGAMGREVWTPNTDTQTNGDDGEAGSTGGINAGLTDVFLTCLDATNGEIQWTVQFGSSAADVGNSVAVGPRGGVFFVGQLGDDDPSARPRAFLAKYDYLGNSQFVARLNSSSPHYAVDLAPSIGSGGEGVVYMSGHTLGDDAMMFLARFEGSTGTQRWLRHLGGEPGSSFNPQSVTVVEGSSDSLGTGGLAVSPDPNSDSGAAGAQVPAAGSEEVEPGSDARVLVVGFNRSTVSTESHTSNGFTVAADTEGAWTWLDVYHEAQQETAIAVGANGRADSGAASVFIVGTVAAAEASPGNYYFLDIQEVVREESPTPAPANVTIETLHPTTTPPSPIGEASTTTGLSQGASLWLLIIAPILVVLSCIFMVGYVSKQCAIVFGMRPREDSTEEAIECATYEDPDTGHRRAARDILAMRRADSSSSSGTMGALPRSDGGSNISNWPRSVVAAFRDFSGAAPYRKLQSPNGDSHGGRRRKGFTQNGGGNGGLEMQEQGGTPESAGAEFSGDEDGLDDELVNGTRQAGRFAGRSAPTRSARSARREWDPLDNRDSSDEEVVVPGSTGNPRDDEPADGEVTVDFSFRLEDASPR